MGETQKAKKKYYYEENMRYSIEQMGIERVIGVLGFKNIAGKQSFTCESSKTSPSPLLW